MSVLPKLEESGKWEKIRRLRFGEIIRLIRHRYGTAGVPDDDAGRPDLMELLYLASQAPAGAEKKIRNCIELYAPWMLAEEVHGIIEHLAIIPDYQKAKTARELGTALHLNNAERERLKLWQFKPIDMTDEQLEEQRRRKSNERRRAKRGRTRAEYLASCLSATRPWEAEGISRSAWERRRRRAASHGRSVDGNAATHGRDATQE
jgi:hypothetical protein